MRLKAAPVFMFYGTVSCLQILDECMSKKNLETYIKGSEMKLRVWVPEIGDATFLTLISKNDRTGMSRKIEIKKNVTTVQTRDEDTVSPEQELQIQNNSLPRGWVNFIVISNENFTVTVPDVNLTLIDVQDVVQDKYIMITGSNVTANCMLPTNQWEVSVDQETFIPLSSNASHDFLLFSRAPFTPVLAVGLDGKESLRFISLTHVFDSESQVLSPFLVYNFTLDYASIDEGWNSYHIQAGDSKISLGSFPREDTPLSLIASGIDDYIIVQGIRKGPDQEGGCTGGDQGEDENGAVPVRFVWMTIIATAILVAIVSSLFIMESTKLNSTCIQITEESTINSKKKLNIFEHLNSFVRVLSHKEAGVVIVL
ncbi:uncharacterized protein LOC134769694 [Penaeus indicus]|uniref:uncharacterized protein LOC134769694 n=1 Tax=Penaeus indicus TaxID=29960 RepID=UPI00300CEB7A